MAGDAIRRDRMVRQLEALGIEDRRVLDAMRRVPREEFVEDALRARAYDLDAALPIGHGQTVSQPWIVARMTELLEPDGRGRVLEIGSGSGYHAAVLAALFEQVYSIERLASLSREARGRMRKLGIENVHFKIFDGSYGWSEFGPYRGIVVTAAAPDIPGPLTDQLEDNGCLVLPILEHPEGAVAASQVLVRVRKREGGLVREAHGPCRFVPLVGKFGVDS
jgi:protein-L-isoaspartate(D-aspartate) O-methyltransferase